MISAPTVPGYEVYDVVGQGGYGTVYRARQLAVGREVALKIDNRVLANERDRRRFLREVTAAGHLSGHPNVIGLYDAGILPDGRPYLVMELCPGGSLESLIRARGHLPPDQVRDIGVRIADALAATHQAGVLHRDIKPANILVNQYGVVGLSDFGLASILDADGAQSATREALTPAYAAPEAFELADPAPAADVYSLAATLYALLCGRPPRFPAGARPSIVTIMRLHHEPVPDIVGVPQDLVAVLRAGLVADPAQRLSSASALRDALAALRLEGAATAGFPSDAAPAPGSPSQGTSAPGYPSAGMATAPPAPPSTVVPVQTAWPNLPSGHPSYPDPLTSRPTSTNRPGQPIPVLSGHLSGTRQPLSGRTTLITVAATAVLIAGSTLAWRALTPGSGSGSASGPGATSSVSGAGGTGGTGASTASGGTTGSGGLAVAGHPVAKCAATAGIPDSGCPVKPECWGGLVVNSGVLVSVEVIPCARSHVWETFAVGSIPAEIVSLGVSSSRQTAASPVAQRLCSPTVLGKALAGAAAQIPLTSWESEAMAPVQEQFNSGDHAFRCLAKVSGMAATGSAFSASTTAYPTQPWP